MKLIDFKEYIVELFGEDKLKMCEGNGEYGFTYKGKEIVKKMGYSTNLTLETVEKAIYNDVDLLLTHHDAWEFMTGLRESCIKRLKEHKISHYYIHLPLDDSEFGTNVSLAEKIGLTVVEKFSLEDGFYCGRVGELSNPVKFDELVNYVEEILKEPIKSWKNNNQLIKRIGIVTGGGLSTNDVKAAYDRKCDVYITGEKLLYTIQYAKFLGINLIIGSHTFTELFGVESLAEKIKEKYNELEIIRINEEHIE